MALASPAPPQPDTGCRSTRTANDMSFWEQRAPGKAQRLLKAPSNLALNISRDGASTTSLGNLVQCLSTLIVKNFFLFKATTPCPITIGPCKKSLSSFLVLEGCYKVFLEPSLLQAEQPQLSQPVFIGEVLQPSDHLHGSPLDLFQQVCVLLMLGAPELDAALQDMVGFLGCKCTLPGHVELLINQHPQVLLLRAALNPFSAQPVFVLGIAPTQVQYLALDLVELHEVRMGPPLKPVKVLLDCIPSLQQVDRTTQLGVVGKLAEGALNPTVHVADKDVKQHWSQYRPLRNATRHWSPLGHQAVECNSLSATIQPIPYPPSGPSVRSMSLQFRDKDVTWDSAKCFAQVQGFIPWDSTKIPEEAKVCSPEVQGSELAVFPPRRPKDLKLHHFMVIAAKAALELHIPHQPLLVGENKVQHSTSPRWFLYHLEKEGIISTFQEPHRLLMPCCVVPPTDIRVELHALQLLIDIEGDTPSLSPLPVLPVEPVSFHSNAPVIGAIPPRCCDADKIIALQWWKAGRITPVNFMLVKCEPAQRKGGRGGTSLAGLATKSHVKELE
ncbi:hypothetical protein QYF61_010916 [Mycteria americana]|uniref:Uncharacterized protein n=1 Tax=Mycteria americana TaxID=33587 RepID=A0AAN7PQ77_MYCAM|nr:hypothetical protein QYF61_010916 [Mycteria americana]